VSGRDVPAVIELAPDRPPSGSATAALVMVSSAAPNALDSRSRNADPPADTRSVCRSVASANTTPSLVNGSGGNSADPMCTGAAVQVVIHRPPGMLSLLVSPSLRIPVLPDPQGA
jgi:hypothetical protein